MKTTNNNLFAYGLKNRGVSIGTQPNGFHHFEDTDKEATGFYSIVYYEKELTSKEIADFELTPILSAPEPSKARPEEKTDSKELTPEEVIKAVTASDDWKTTAWFYLNPNRNASAIMAAGIDADVFSLDDFVNFIMNGALPEYHTFNAWKAKGYSVCKGERAAFKANIWKYTEKKTEMTAEQADALNAVIVNSDGTKYEEGDETTSGHFIRKTSFFFGPDQVKRNELKPLTTLPDDVTEIVKNGTSWISGNTKPIKEDLKAAGYRWNRKESAWYKVA